VTEPSEHTPEGTEPQNLEAVADQVEETLAEISVGAALPVEMGAAPAVEAAPDPQEEPEAAKKPARRRRRKTANAEKSVNETEPASEAEAAQNVADADAAGLTFPGKAYDLTPAAEATPAEATPAEAAPAGAPAEATPEASPEAAAPEAPAEAEAPAAKPVRRRRTRKKADETPSE
jgi:ribonuclease E